MCNCSKDQTPQKVFEYLKKQDRADRGETGLGLFLVPDPESGILENRVVYVEELTYVEVAKRGQNCVAFMWIPKGFMDAQEVRNQRERNCRHYWCGPNRDWCPIGCFCGWGNYCS